MVHIDGQSVLKVDRRQNTAIRLAIRLAITFVFIHDRREAKGTGIEYTVWIRLELDATQSVVLSSLS